MQTGFNLKAILFGGMLSVAFGQAGAVSASVGATVIDPESVLTSLADLPVRVVTYGGWIRVVIPSARLSPQMSILLSPLNAQDMAVRLPSSSDGDTEEQNTDGTLNGEIATSLSALMPLLGGGYRLTVSFN